MHLPVEAVTRQTSTLVHYHRRQVDAILVVGAFAYVPDSTVKAWVMPIEVHYTDLWTNLISQLTVSNSKLLSSLPLKDRLTLMRQL